MTQRKVLVLLLFAALLPAGCQPAAPPFECTDTLGCVEVAPGEPIKIGALQALSGSLGPQGSALLQPHVVPNAARDPHGGSRGQSL